MMRSARDAAEPSRDEGGAGTFWDLRISPGAALAMTDWSG
ncbi:hypothetical protein K701_07955 [Streptomyces fradiae ATCC 10745 = DSM 40063]|uniref:Uncharacterized protein n=1 Tax=Streptomyces fradiae ATCC 10745 = DSM 40063 TaxID=1319510 RepID=A0ABQ6XXM5_STRFR|nr:hypothetical protein K701_07955 [Streptomyces fradiae ATCC 10745 = DSM 40063]